MWELRLGWQDIGLGAAAALALAASVVVLRGRPAEPAPEAPPRPAPAGPGVILGPSAIRPLALQLPVLILGLGRVARPDLRLAVAEAATLAGAAVEGSEGPEAAGEREVSDHFARRLARGGLRALADAAPALDLLLLEAPGAPSLPAQRRARAGVRYLMRRAAGPPIAVEMDAPSDVEACLEVLLDLGPDVLLLRQGAMEREAWLKHLGRARRWLRATGQESSLSLVAVARGDERDALPDLFAAGADAVAITAEDLLRQAFGPRWADARPGTAALRTLRTLQALARAIADRGELPEASPTAEPIAAALALSRALRQTVALWRAGLAVWRDLARQVGAPEPDA